MKVEQAKQMVAETGKMLLDQGLVARTWGNVSCRIDDNTYAITPSGLDYVGMKAEDIVVVDRKTMKWSGLRKPSGEKGIHSASYQVFPDVNFVIHTHQTYATAIGLAGFQNLDITEQEREELGGIALAEYGLPGTRKLTKHVTQALLKGAHVVFMAHHGALVCGKDREDALHKAILLEDICKRNVQCVPSTRIIQQDYRALLAKVRQLYPGSVILSDQIILQAAANGSIKTQVDDMAQMIGSSLKLVSEQKALAVLTSREAVLVKGIGAVIRTRNEEDRIAMGILIRKAAICSSHTRACGMEAFLSKGDVALMRLVYQLSYSKQK